MRFILAILFLICVLPVQAVETVASYQEKLQQRIEDMKSKKSSWTAEDKAIMKNSSAIIANELPNPGLKVGEKAPDFTLGNAFGETLSLYDELKKGPVILVFYRGSWCPYCNMHLRALQQSLPAFTKHGARLITVTPQTPDKSSAQVKKDGYLFEVLSDLNNKVMKSYKLYFEPPKELITLYKKHELDIEEFNGEGRSGLPVPGAFVIDQKGIIQAMQAQTDYKSRMEPQAILDALIKMEI
ncbi:MAG: AhpC/TSA family protein [Colwellia sp.]|nr:AhpC/TSA family protein [Colwellia sp.]